MAQLHTSAPTRWVFPPHGVDKEAYPKDDPNERLVPELLIVGYQKIAEAFPIPLHSHDGAYEFVYLQNGSATWEIDGILYPMNAGQWFYTRPGELHKARFNHLEPSRIWWLILQDPVSCPIGSDSKATIASSRYQGCDSFRGYFPPLRTFANSSPG